MIESRRRRNTPLGRKEIDMNLKKLITKGVVGEKLPVQPVLMAKLMGSKGKVAVVVAAVTALIAAVAELM
jgi:hypothetical protein